MSRTPTLDDLWNHVPSATRTFEPGSLGNLPEPARRYLCHAILPGTRLASAVRLKMHGSFRINGEWAPFSAEQVNRWDGEFLWRATMHLHGIPITGFDSLVNGQGVMRWKLFGVFPLATGEGPDITRSAIGRLEGETFWLPSLFLQPEVTWTAFGPSLVTAGLYLQGEKAELAMTLAENGRVEQLRYQRWGNPEGEAFHYTDFGGVVEEEYTFGGYTIPTRLRAGWRFGSERFESEGEFFRCFIEEAEFR